MKILLKRFWNHMTKPSMVIWQYTYSFLTYFTSPQRLKYLSLIFLAIATVFLVGMIYQKKKNPTI